MRFGLFTVLLVSFSLNSFSQEVSPVKKADVKRSQFSSDKVSNVEDQNLSDTLPYFVYGSIEIGDSISIDDLRLMLNDEVPVKIVGGPRNLNVLSGRVILEGVDGEGMIVEKGILSEQAKSILKKSKGRWVSIIISYNQDGIIKRGGLAFFVY